MLVKELIEELKKSNPEKEVDVTSIAGTHDDRGCFDEVGRVAGYVRHVYDWDLLGEDERDEKLPGDEAVSIFVGIDYGDGQFEKTVEEQLTKQEEIDEEDE